MACPAPQLRRVGRSQPFHRALRRHSTRRATPGRRRGSSLVGYTASRLGSVAPTLAWCVLKQMLKINRMDAPSIRAYPFALFNEPDAARFATGELLKNGILPRADPPPVANDKVAIFGKARLTQSDDPPVGWSVIYRFRSLDLVTSVTKKLQVLDLGQPALANGLDVINTHIAIAAAIRAAIPVSYHKGGYNSGVIPAQLSVLWMHAISQSIVPAATGAYRFGHMAVSTSRYSILVRR